MEPKLVSMEAILFQYVLQADEKALRLLIDDYNAGTLPPKFMAAMDAVEAFADEQVAGER